MTSNCSALGRSLIRMAGIILLLGLMGWVGVRPVAAAPRISRLTPPSTLFSFTNSGPPYIARFLPGQRFDLQMTVIPDRGQTIAAARFAVDGTAVPGTVSVMPATATNLPANSVIATIRAYATVVPGVHVITATATQSDNQSVSALGNFELVAVNPTGSRAKNIIVLIGDGMGIAHRTAARIVSQGAELGKAKGLLAMDTLPFTGMVMTHSLNSIVTDSSPGAACYSSGNKANNNQHGVFPDDTLDNFDNPRVELMGEYLARTLGTSLGIVTTADVADSTPAAFGTHTQSRNAGTGLSDQFLDEAAAKAGLVVLLGGGRKWFLPGSIPGSFRSNATDYVLPLDLAAGWGVNRGMLDTNRNLIADFQTAGFSYATDTASLAAIPTGTRKLLGLFSLASMNVAKDKIDKRRSPATHGVVDDYGFPNQPMLDEMTRKALEVLRLNPNGFVLMVEGASIDKQAHSMDTERWILDTIEFDHAVEVCQRFAATNRDTLMVVTADHETAGVSIIGASRVTNTNLAARAQSGGGVEQLRGKLPEDGTNDVNRVVGTYEAAGFPKYAIAADGYPVTTDVDRRLIIGYGANADRYEDWLTNPLPLQDSQQPFNNVPPLNTYPIDGRDRDTNGAFFLAGQVPDLLGSHTAEDVPISAQGPGAAQFSGVMDNTDVFFKMMQALLGGAP